jgi:uncharacterized protein (TIGR04255 family)
MARPPQHLTRAPIDEAVIDFRVLRRNDITSDRFAGLVTRIGPDYNRSSEMQSIHARFGVQGGRPLEPTQMQATVGWMYQAPTAIAQFRVDGFTFSKLRPYTTWEEVFGEALRLWNIYVEVAQPLEVLSRVAVRYINRLRFPAPADLGEYLEAPPVLPAPIPQSIREFLIRAVVDDPERGLSAILIEALESPLDPNTVQVLLDIDAFKEADFAPGDPSLRETFEQLRALKNRIFFASITERTVEMYA